ncbi:MAG: 4Fe-4S dicluster domain-containing protein [Myxococcales bacterium]|nr:MAG: 4Fe-4S dicluster domain-containing protein [Myxococcales bacterium]
MHWAIYLAALLVVWIPYTGVRRYRSAQSRAVLAESQALGLLEPVSLHPKIDESECIGCASCIDACPEEDVLGLIDGKARLVRASNCIGHGACSRACPVGAIQLVFGTETRGVEIPLLAEDFQTSVPGLFIAGELGGMGLIRNAVEQGRQAVESVRRLDGIGSGDPLDLLIVGAGPAGFSASLAAKAHGLRALTIEQETLGGAVAHYPRGKIVMTGPMQLPLYGPVRLRETSKESLIGLWREVERRTRPPIRYQERMTGIERMATGFEVRTSRGRYRARAVLLAIGRRGTPRKLGVPGEELDKVVYRLIEPEQYRDRRVLVVGGGDSALEAAARLAEDAQAETTLSYRGSSFPRAKPQNRARVEALASAGRLRLLLGSEITGIEEGAVHLRRAEREDSIANDALIVCAGGELPTALLRAIGVAVETKFGTA